ncbi:MAG: type VI secretion system tip protein TssI/VgrG [Polyangiaceae bacterium]
MSVALSLQSGVELSVVHFSVHEHLSANFLIQLSAHGDAELDTRGIVGRGAVFALEGRGGRRVWTGVCSSITQTTGGATARPTGRSQASYSLTVAPALWLLGQRRNYRAYQHLSVPEIAVSLLAEWGIKPRLELDLPAYPKLEYRVQYGETDYNFLRRQLADAGIVFYFDTVQEDPQKPEETHVVLADMIQYRERRAGVLPYVDDSGLASADEHVTHVSVVTEVRQGRITLRDHDIRRPMYALFGQHASQAEPENLLEEYVYEPGLAAAAPLQPRMTVAAPKPPPSSAPRPPYRQETGSSWPFEALPNPSAGYEPVVPEPQPIVFEPAAPAPKPDGNTPVADTPLAYRHQDGVAATRARLVGESIRPGGLAIHFSASVVDIGAGTLFKVSGHHHPAVSSNSGLLVVECALSGETEGDWSLTGMAVPGNEPYRPGRAEDAIHGDLQAAFGGALVPSKPKVLGVESAIVVGPQNEEIHVDELGRVRVRFHWDREEQGSSCWVRVSHAWAGAGYGATFLPRVGHEVIVAFVGGDPDLPVVVGRVHAPTIPSPWAVPEHKTKSAIRTSSTPGGTGFNEIMFDDAKGRETLLLRAERDMSVQAQNDRISQVGRTDTVVVGQSLRLVVANSDTGIEISNGRIVLTTGQASVVLEGGTVSVVAASNLSTPPWVDGGSKGSVGKAEPAATAPAKTAKAETPKPTSDKPPCVKLGINKKYKGAILDASKRTGVPPNTIAAMVNAEAAPIRHGAEKGIWDPNSDNGTHLGLGQFSVDTWSHMATTPGTALNEKAVESGYVQAVTHGKRVSYEVVSGHAGDLAELRRDPDLSISSLAEYAQQNLGKLDKENLVSLSTLSEEDYARTAYIAHHEGFRGAERFLDPSIADPNAPSRLRRQLRGARNADARYQAYMDEAGGDGKKAYAKFLNEHMEKKVTPGKYKCSEEAVDGDEAPSK